MAPPVVLDPKGTAAYPVSAHKKGKKTKPCVFPKLNETDKLLGNYPEFVGKGNLPPSVEASPFYKHLLCPSSSRHFRSFPVFRDARLYEMVKNLPRVLRDQKVCILYPAAGSHLAPLDLVNNIYEQKDNNINSATLIFTEIEKEALVKMKTLLKKLAEEGVYTTPKEDRISYPHGGSETTFTFSYKGKEVKLIYALNMSGDSYYKEEYLAQSDVWVIHDPYNGDSKDSFKLLKSLLVSAGNNKIVNPSVIVMENINDYFPPPGALSLIQASHPLSEQENETTYYEENLLPGQKIKIPFSYGHRNTFYGFGESGSSFYQSAIAYMPDINLFKRSPEEIGALLDQAHSSVNEP